ncbi:MAG TPA: FxLYD domain-containing protein [Gemmatimonadaceae bacterium]|jgi:hypothetical protein|nr:FxLYD domain-containing protein [Gemmatimonadaceae bacterium]
MLALSRRTRAMLALGAACTFVSLATSATAAAQKDKNKNGDASAKCSIDDNQPSEVLSAKLYMTKAKDASADTAAQTKDYQGAVAQLTGKNAKINNVAGRDYVLAQAYVGLLNRPNASPVGSKGSFGFKDDPTSQIDLVAALDTTVSGLSAALTAKPECKDVTRNLREQVYVPLVNRGITQLNAKQPDSAAALATRASQVYPEGPYSYYILATVALQKKDPTTASAQYQKTIDAVGSDTAYTKLKLEVYYNQGVVYQQMAAAATGPDKAAFAKKAMASFKQVVDANPGDANAKAGYAAALAASGDTAALVSSYGDRLANPSKYTALELFQSGITAAQANHIKDADSLFTLGLVKNPYFPDAVLYVANNAFNNKQIDKLTPLARRLLDLTPNNTEAYRLTAGAFQLRSKGDKTPAAQRSDADSTLKYYQKYKEMPIEVSITQFAVDSNATTMAGNVANRGTAPKSVSLTFQLLDTNGSVVATQAVPAMTVAPGGSQAFSFKATGTGIAGYKYAPVN